MEECNWCGKEMKEEEGGICGNEESKWHRRENPPRICEECGECERCGEKYCRYCTGCKKRKRPCEEDHGEHKECWECGKKEE